MLPDVLHDTHDDSDTEAPAVSESIARQRAIKQIERKRRYWITTAMSALGMILLTAIWAFSEYHNAGGWPTSGFSQSSGIPNVWNYWVIYPWIAYAFLSLTGGLVVYLRKPISESQIKREMERQH
jgi:hypothetical protein